MNRSRPLPLAMVTSLGLLVLAAIPAPALPETATSPSTVIEWWDTTGPGAAMTVIRLAAMVACGYVAAVAALYTLADALRLGWLRRLALLAASPGLRRQLSAGALTLAVVATPATAHAQAAHDEPSIVLTDVGAVPAGHQVEAEPSSILIADIGPAIIEPPAEQTVRHVTPPGPHVDGFGHYEVTAAPDAWVVEAGDHLWAIAEHLLEAAGRPTDDGTVAGYWTRLIAANTAALDGDPDLLHVGQVISLPPLDQG